MYASTLFFTFSVKLSRGFFWHAFNFYLQRASSHTSLHREKTFPSSSPQPWFLLYSLFQRLPNAAIVCWAPGCCSATHPEEKGDKPQHPQSSRIILVPPAPRKNSHPLPLPDGMGLGVSQHRHCMSYMWCFNFLEKKNQSGSLYLQKALQIICAVHIKDLHGSSTGFAHYGSQGAAAWGKEWTSVTREEMQVNF